MAGGRAGPVTDDIAEGPVAGGRCEACGMAGDEDASVGPITAGCMPVACAAGPITEGAKRRMSQSSLSACLTDGEPGAPPHVAEPNHPQRLREGIASHLQVLRRAQSSPVSANTKD